jgi:hypothetical protein
MPSGYGTANHAFGPDSYYTPNKNGGGSDEEQEHDELYDQY